MSKIEEKFGIEAIEAGERTPEKLKGPETIDDPEKLGRFGETVKKEVDRKADETKQNTTSGLNEVDSNYTKSTNMPERERYANFAANLV